MQLGTFEPRAREDFIGDQLAARDAVDKPLIVFVREHRQGIKTKFNQDPTNTRTYKPEGGDGVIVDAADVTTDEVWIDVLWLNGAIVDNLAPYVGQAVPIKLAWQAPQGGGNSFIIVTPLTGDQLSVAQKWAAGNSTRFDTERAQRAANTAAHEDGATQAAPLQPVAMTPEPPAASTALNPSDPAVAALLAQLAAQQNTAS